MGTPLGLKYIPYTYMDPLGFVKGSGSKIIGLRSACKGELRFTSICKMENLGLPGIDGTMSFTNRHPASGAQGIVDSERLVATNLQTP